MKTWEVQAILDGRKTMTRRTVKWPTIPDWHDQDHAAYATYKGKPIFRLYDQGGLNSEKIIPCPYGGVGDRLWVKEGVVQIGHERPMRNGQYPWPKLCDKFTEEVARNWLDKSCFYTADEPHNSHLYYEPHGKLNKMFMPRWASRITLEITGVRVERLQEIGEEDIRSEGVVMSPLHVGIDMSGNAIESENAHLDPWDYFIDLWQSIHGRDSWSANPWVWAITFKVVTPARAGG